MAYWWCLKHNAVEQGGRFGWFHGNRLGPYPTEQAAAHALAGVAEREERLTAEDRDWESGGTSEPG